MNGADVLCDTLLANNVDVCFSNPGTSEMHFVAALDKKPEMRCILGLFEGVVTGAADGYARMAEKPAANLLHLGPGLGNGLANLHNARRARVPMVNIVGDHASYHLQYDAPLTSDIEGVAGPMSDWVHRMDAVTNVGRDVAEAVKIATTLPGSIATLILPADVAWSEVSRAEQHGVVIAAPQVVEKVPVERVAQVASFLQSDEPTLFLVGGRALRSKPLELLGRIAKKCNADLMATTSGKRTERGMGRTYLPRLPYPIDAACAVLAPYRRIVLISAQSPVAFFAYPGKPSLLAPENAQIVSFVQDHENILEALEHIADRLGVLPNDPLPSRPDFPQSARNLLNRDTLTGAAICAAVAQNMPEDAIICDESISQGRNFTLFSTSSPPYDYLQLTGGAIGAGIPLAIGAAIACPGRKVIALEGDGSGMYTLQGLWTQARESLNCVTIVFSNRRYAVLYDEMKNVGATSPGRNADRMLQIDYPALDWVSLAKGMGVSACRVDSLSGFTRAFRDSLEHEGPMLIEAVI